MSTEIKHILFIVIICITIIITSVFEIENQSKQYKSIKNSIDKIQVEIEDKEDKEKVLIDKTEITENPKEEVKQQEEVNSLVEQPVTESQIDNTDYSVPSNNTIKSYMDYKCITSTNSRQYKLQRSLAQTDSNGLRVVNGRYCVAVGSYYTTTIGQYIDIELENGNIIKGILADCKANKHTDSTNRINPNGSVVEFVVDTKSLSSTAKKMGDISYVNGWNSKVINIKVYDTIENF